MGSAMTSGEHLLSGVLCEAIELIDAAGAFTEEGMRRALKRHFATGYSDGEVAHALLGLTETGRLTQYDDLFRAGPRFPKFQGDPS